jgi:hypothetical protein
MKRNDVGRWHHPNLMAKCERGIRDGKRSAAGLDHDPTAGSRR